MWYFNPGDCNTAILYILYHQSRHGAVKKWRGGTNHKRCSRCPGFFMVSRFHTGRANRKGSSTANKTTAQSINPKSEFLLSFHLCGVLLPAEAFLFPQLDGIVFLSGIWKNRSRGAIIHHTIIINTRNSRLNLCAKPLLRAIYYKEGH